MERDPERIKRALSQRMFLLNAKRDKDQWIFQIEGSRGVSYTVKMPILISDSTSVTSACCTCPDYERRRLLCKHIMFISIRVLKMHGCSSFIDKEMDSKLSYITERDVSKKQIDDTCPICFEESMTEYEQCSVCKNNIHTSCISIWLRQKETCPLCRSKWTCYDILDKFQTYV